LQNVTNAELGAIALSPPAGTRRNTGLTLLQSLRTGEADIPLTRCTVEPNRNSLQTVLESGDRVT